MYRYPTKTDKNDAIMCTHSECESRDGATTSTYINKFRIDFVCAGKKEVVICPDLFTNQVCTRCFLKIIQSEINKLDITEQLH